VGPHLGPGHGADDAVALVDDVDKLGSVAHGREGTLAR
jgi:hypothetical protein